MLYTIYRNNLCCQNQIVYFFHWLLYCTCNDLRVTVFHETAQLNSDIFWCTDGQRLDWLFNCDMFKLADVSKVWKRRLEKSTCANISCTAPHKQSDVDIALVLLVLLHLVLLFLLLISITVFYPHKTS